MAPTKKVNPRIREASLDDLAAVLATDRLGSDPKRREKVARAVKEGRCWLAELDDNAVGYVVADESFYGYPFVCVIVVAPTFRRHGIASVLMRHAESQFDADKLFTSTNESNVASQGLMESLGYQRSGWIDNLDEGDPEIVYVKRRDSN